jgi:hypothetical protein
MRMAVLTGFLIAALTAGPAVAQPAANPQQRFGAADLRADFAAMYQGLQSADYDLYAFTPKAELDRAYETCLAGLNEPMTKLEAEIRFEEFAALVHMGHARVDFPYPDWNEYLKGGGKAFPFAIRVVNGNTYIAQNHSGLDAIRPGDEILAMNGSPMPAWLTRAERHVSAETPYMADSLMEYDFPIYVWIELGNVEGFTLTLRHTDGKTVEFVAWHSLRALRRRSQRDKTNWASINRLLDRWIPKPTILHPWPNERFAVKHPRWEPYAGKPLVRFCAGGAQ